MARKANTRKSSRKASQPEDLSEYNNPVDDFSEQRERRMEAKLHTGDTDDEDDIMAQVDNEYEIKGDVDFEESNDVRTKKSSKSKKAASAAASSAKPLKQLPAEIDPELPFMVRRKIALANKKPLDSDDEADQQPEEDATAGWGAKSEFYDGDDYEDASEEGEAEEEEKEARKLQVRAAKMVSADDYLAPTVSKKSKQPVQATVADDDEDEDAEQDGVLERIERNVQLLSAEEKLRIVRKDSPELEGMLRELNEKLREVKDNVQPLLDKARAASSAEVREQGVSFLELKYHLLLAYCLNVSFYLLLKTEGKSVRDHPVVEQLLRIRAYLEKIKPIEAKLKYQLDKLLKSKPTEKSKKKAKKAVADDEDEDQDMRPRIGEMADDDDEADVGSNLASSKYQAPTLESVDLDDRSSKSKKKDKSVERLRKSSMLKSLREELGDAPLAMKSIGADADLEAASDSDAEDERERRAYEEDHFTRLALTRKDKRKEKDRKKRATLGDGLEDLEDFADLAALDDAVARAQEDKIESTRKAEALRAALKSVDDEERKTKSSRRSGDVDLAPRLPNQPLPKPNSSKKRAVPEDESDIEDDMAGPALSEDEMYMAAEAATRDRKKAKKADDKERKKQAKTKEVFLHSEDDEVDDEDEKRKASDKIIKNRGLTAYRSKEDRNPRVKLRKKFDKASKKHRSIVRPMREKSDVYSGESHGIKKNVSRSVSLGQRR